MSFPAYPNYQNSGVDWLGEVPSHWTVQRLKHSVASARNGLWGNEPQGDDTDIICVRVADFDRGRFRVKLDEPTLRSVTAKEREGRLLEAGNLLLEKSGGGEKQPVGAVVLYDHADAAICSNFVARVQLEKAMHPPYWCYVHAAAYSVRLTVGSINQTSGIQNLDQARYFDEQAPYPPFGEQVAIAAFLDRETAKIDALIEEQRCLIGLLKEKRQAVISHAVIKGLDPHAPMKDSGTEWLGKVPAHWRVAPLKRAANVIAGFAFSANAFSLDSDNWRLLRGINLSASGIRWNEEAVYWQRSNEDGLDAWELRAGDVVLGMDRPWIGGGLRVAAITDDDLPCLLLQRVAAVRAECSAAQRFILHCLRHEAFYHHCAPEMTGVSVPHISGGQIEEFRIPLPPTDEMDAIAQHIDDRTAALASLIETAQSAISLFNERRAALISAAVTGKIDVRGPAKVLPFPVDRTRVRGLIATEIIERLAHQATFGRVKFQKIAFLVEAHVGISELEGSYTREAAGPLDRILIDEMESEARNIAAIEHEQPGGPGTTVSYRLGQQVGVHRQELMGWLDAERTAKLDKLIADFAPLNTKQAEAVATLYGVWNDLLSEGASPSDDEIISGFLNDWHPKKRAKFRASELPEWLGWMRRHGIVPTGSGPKTTTGRLFV